MQNKLLGCLWEFHESVPRKYKIRIAVFAMLLVILLCVPPIFSGGRYVVSPIKENGVTFVTLSVGQSNAALILGEGCAFMVDTGANAAEDTVIAALNYYGVKIIDGIFLTHEDEDHAGGLDRILDERSVRRVILTRECYLAVMQTGAEEHINRAVKEKGTEIVYAECGQTLAYAPLSVESRAPVGLSSSENDDSLVLRVVYGETAAIFLGDIEDTGEKALYLDVLSKQRDIRSALLMVAHHGAATSSNGALLKEISPQFAVISCGTDNSYGHPSAVVLERLRLLGAEVHRTDLEGTITIHSDGKIMRYED